jgi:tetratricopeptide (TPR) repeat protein
MTPTDEKRTAVSTSPGAGVQAAELPASATAIPLEAAAPPVRQLPASPDSPPGKLEWGLFVAVAVLGFLLASFPARNSDIWMHLARGRQVAQGALSAAAQADRPSWLFDLVSYELYAAVGDSGLLLFKALLVGALAVVLLLVSHSGRGWWLPIGCTALALLGVGIRLLFEPAIASYLFLALALWFLRPRAEGPSPLLARWPLVVVFALWANMDAWFVLGLAVVALIELGRVLDALIAPQSKSGESAVAALATVVGVVAACLLNPLGVGAFEKLPPELLALLPGSTSAASQTTWQRYFALQGWSPAGVAYFVLATAGLGSFLLALPRFPLARLLPWLALAVASAVEVKVVPFFAVVAGPVLAWNLRDFLARREGHEPSVAWQRGTAIGRALTVLAVVVLVVCAWPGWLQPGQALSGAEGGSRMPIYQPRNWAVETPPALEEGARTTQRWIRERKLNADGKGLHISRDTLNAFAWFCPEEHTLVNTGLADAILGAKDAPADWASQMRKERIDHVVFYSPDLERVAKVMDWLMEGPRQLPLLYAEGSVVVFGWRDPKTPDRFRDSELDANRLAFRAAENEEVTSPPSEEELESRTWHHAYWKGVPPRSKELEEAWLYLKRAEAMRRRAPERNRRVWEYLQLAALVGAASGWSGPKDVFDAHVRIVRVRPANPAPGQQLLPQGADLLGHAMLEKYLMSCDESPPALLYLAIRAARKALALNPEDAHAYLVLGESYLRLIHATREKVWTRQFNELLQLRRAQAVSAFTKAVTLRPDLAEAHMGLGNLYRDLEYHDLALKHLRKHFELKLDRGPPPGKDLDQWTDEVQDFEDRLKGMTRDVERRQSNAEVASEGKPVLYKAEYAARQGLAGKALDLLLESDISAFGTRGMGLEIELLLRTGQPERVRDWTGPELQTPVDPADYYWRRIQALAACGDYDRAIQTCDERYRLASVGPDNELIDFRRMLSMLVSHRVLNEYIGGTSLPGLVWMVRDRFGFVDRKDLAERAMHNQADMKVLHGLLALEKGALKDAEINFREALSYWKDEQTAASGGGLEFRSRPVAQSYLSLMELAAAAK